MPTDRRSKRATGHPINGSPAERARYFNLLARWARDEVNLWTPEPGGDKTMSGSRG